ncbi:MAG: hypothetical protein QW279_15570, partial [Candidatus Jordarchaeaceae archaeon]
NMYKNAPSGIGLCGLMEVGAGGIVVALLLFWWFKERGVFCLFFLVSWWGFLLGFGFKISVVQTGHRGDKL